MIPFNIPPYLQECSQTIEEAIALRKICGDGEMTKRCSEVLEDITGASKVLLTTSGTSALELAALLLDIKEGDEVIMPSYTFVSTANAFALRGAKIIFVDVQKETMNIDPVCIERAITEKTKVIVVVHYAGVCCDMERINAIAKKNGLYVVEDAAQAVTSTYKGKQAGCLCDIGCFSFHETKNFSMGEGGAIVLNDERLVERAEIMREKGTNRSRFFRGQVDKYTWVDMGSSFLPSELNAAYLLPQLKAHKQITAQRMMIWESYDKGLKPLADDGLIECMHIPTDCGHNAHMYYIKLKNLKQRTEMIAHLKENGVLSVFHYIPLHTAPAGLKYSQFVGEDIYTTADSERILRLPLYFEMTEEQANMVIKAVYAFFEKASK